ncbi:peptidoglycan-associated lipoprotein Pal [soil metagenome]
MRIRRFALSAALAVVLAVMAGCSTSKLLGPAAPAAKPAVVVAPAATPSPRPATSAQSAPTKTVRAITAHPLDNTQTALGGRSFFHDFDSFVIHDAEGMRVDAHSKYLGGNRTARVRIEGHTDQRGGREYNPALGQQRAEAVRKSLQLLGAPDAEMEATRFGEERPMDSGHDEGAWTSNRRADLNCVSG